MSLILLSSLCYFFSYPEVDPDLWGHLFFGKEILKSGAIPPVNLYSYTAPGYPWINHEWLSEIIFYGVYHYFGSPGLIFLKLLLGGAMVWLIDRVLKKEISSPWARALALVWVMAIVSPGFNIRPQIFTYFLFVLLLFVLDYSEATGSTALFALPFLMGLWANLHGGFVAGVGALTLFSLWAVIGRLRRKEGAGSTARVVILLILSGLALLLNPYGIGLLKFVGGDLLLQRPITEWEPVPLLALSFLSFKLGVIFFLVAAVRKKTWRRWDFALALLAALFALRQQRHTPLFALAAAPFLAAGLEEAFHFVKSRSSQWLLAAALGGLALYQLVAIGEQHWKNRFRLVVNPEEYPTQAAEFLMRNHARGNLAAPFDWGEYLIWKLYPEVRVSIDGRYTTAYPTQVIADNWEWMSAAKGWKGLLDRYPTELAITRRGDPVTALMRRDPEWVYIYSDPAAFVFVRKTAAQEQLLTRFRQRTLVPPQSPRIDFPG